MKLGITRKGFINYAVLPGLRPRIAELFATGFHYIPFFIALVFSAGRLLPPNHPYANPANLGRFGIRHVIGEAANNLILDRKHIDQIVLFACILIGLVLIFVQIGLLGFALLFQPVMAQMPTSFEGFFLTPAATRPQDLAHIFLDMVFGVPGMFDSCVALAANGNGGEICRDSDGIDIVNSDGVWILASLGFPFPIHEGLHQMFQVYSIGLLIVATLITLYFITAVLAETMQTGTAFGKRFNKVWAPLRIVVAFGLLVPIGYGLNASQYIVLYAAKFGSGFATNGWNLFNQSLEQSYLGDVKNLISRPNVPEVGGLLQFMYVARVCAELEELKNHVEVNAYLVRDPLSTPNYLRLSGSTRVSYEDMIKFINGSKQAIIRFGLREDESSSFGSDGAESPNPGFRGGIRPLCGELTLPLTDPRDPANANSTKPGVHGPEPGPEIMQRYYWYVLYELWDIVFDLDSASGETLQSFYGDIADYTENYPQNVAFYWSPWKGTQIGAKVLLPPPAYRSAVQQFYSRDLEAAMLNPAATYLESVLGPEGALEAQRKSASWAFNDPTDGTQTNPILEKGWAAAGIWYNKVAELNGAVTASVLNIPLPSRYPEIMEYVYLKKKQQDQNVPMSQRFEPKLANKEDVPFRRTEDGPMAVAMWKAFDYWQSGGATSTTRTAPTKNAFVDAINFFFGTSGLFSMRQNEDVHPLAQLVGVGRSLVESAIRNLGFAALSGGVGGLGGMFLEDSLMGKVGSLGVGFFMMVAMITLTTGFILFYIVPFLPFIYFFFAVGGWVKGIFEAMVGAPLWALAHIRIDGNGLPGPAAANGYFLIFEIFIRPILIVFGLLAAISIFSAQVAVLNQIWDLVVYNVSGFDLRTEISGEVWDGTTTIKSQSFLDVLRNPIDTFFFTLIYTLIVYLMAMASFKLIDLIPNNILRWMGSSVSTFNDQAEDPAQGLVGTSYVGGQQAISQVGGGVQQALTGVANLKKQPAEGG